MDLINGIFNTLRCFRNLYITLFQAKNVHKFIIPLILLTLIVQANGAVIEGNVYTWELKKIKAIVEINTTPKQRVVAENGSYSFTVSEGDYVIIAYTDDLFCEENVSITGNGTYRIDLILFPKLEYDVNFTEPSFELEENNHQNIIFFAVIIVSITAFAIVVIVIKRKSKSDNSELPEDLVQVLEILRKSGGRATQKELREKTGWSEAKLSLVLTDLERRGLIEKYKRGRGNVIFLK